MVVCHKISFFSATFLWRSVLRLRGIEFSLELCGRMDCDRKHPSRVFRPHVSKP